MTKETLKVQALFEKEKTGFGKLGTPWGGILRLGNK